jgi:hypothetical protein
MKTKFKINDKVTTVAKRGQDKVWEIINIREDYYEFRSEHGFIYDITIKNEHLFKIV